MVAAHHDWSWLTLVKGVPIKLTALINDTTGTLIASAYTDTKMKIGCILAQVAMQLTWKIAGQSPS